MAIEFHCTNCSCRLRVGDDASGRQAKCPQCGTVMTVPELVAAEWASSPSEGPAAASPPPTPPPASYPDIPSYLAQAILCTLFCCLPFGIVAIVFAAQVNGKLAVGDYRGAAAVSNTARTWCWVSFWCGLIPALLYMLFLFLAAAGGH